MAADQPLFSANKQTSVTCRTLVSNIEGDALVIMPEGAPVALNVINANTASSLLESNVLRVQTNLAGAQNSIDGSLMRESSRELHSSLISCTTDIDRTTTHNVRCSLKRTLLDCAAHQFKVPAADKAQQLELVVFQDNNEEHCKNCCIGKAHEMQLSPSKKPNPSREGITGLDEEEEEVLDQEEEEEGCVTPTARDQRNPEYNVELDTSGLVCPPAPKKKPNCAAKRRRIFYSASDADADVQFHALGAERQAFLVDPPDLHEFPDCIRALFK